MNSFPQHQTIYQPFIMTVQNQFSGGVLKNKFNLGQNQNRLFQFLAKLSLTTTETKLGCYHHKWSARVVPLVGQGNFKEIPKKLGIKGKCPVGHPKWKFQQLPQEVVKKALLRHFIEAPTFA